MKNKVLLAILLVLGITQSYAQTTHVVTNTNNSGTGSLRQLVTNAVAGDIIRFAPSLIASGNATIVLTSEIPINKALTINGIYNANYTLSISGNNANRIFNLVAATNLVTLDSLVMINGRKDSNHGGAIIADDNSPLTITNCRLNNNSCHLYGGAIYTESALTLTNCTLSSNYSSNYYHYCYGGAIYTTSTLSLTDCTLTGNSTIGSTGSSSTGGGAIYAFSALTLTNCTLNNNSASALSSSCNGGAIHANSTLTLTNCTLNGNSAYSDDYECSGGAIYTSSSSPSLTLTKCSLTNNSNTSTWSGSGGAIYNSNTATLTNCSLTGNSSNLFASAINSDILTLTNCRVSGNPTSSSSSARVIFAHNALTLTNSTIVNNSSNIKTYSNANVILKNSIVAFNGTGEQIQQSNGSQQTVTANNSYISGRNLTGQGTGNFNGSEAILFVNPTTDFHLQGNSPLANAGDNSLLPADTYDVDGDGNSAEQLPVDLDGSNRVIGTVDVGAYERCGVSGTDIQTACGSYTWIDEIEYTSSNNTATYTFPGGAASGCDSIVTLNLTIEDNAAPVPTLTTLADVTGICSVSSLTAPTATDCSGTVTVTHNASLPITTIGTTVVTWTYDDGHGNTSTQTQNVVVTNPVLGISIVSGSGGSICGGTSVTFTATATDAGSAPAYQWKVNGSNVGTNSSTYTTTTLNNNDVVTCVVTSNLSCINGTTAASNGITMTVTPSPATSVSIVSNVGSSICAGNSVTFTATITNGGTPVYQWQVNGSNVGNNSPTFTTTTLTNGQTVTCLMTSSLICASPAIAVSNAIIMTVGSTATPTINITSNPAAATICSGVSVTFTANTTNGGATPTYQWKLNGNNVGTNSSTYVTTTLVTGDAVTCVLTSSSSCPTVTTVTSNSISKTVNQSVTPTITITSNPSMPVCEHGEVTFTATITNGGTNPDYQWKKNNQNYGIGNPTYSTTLWSNGDEFKCVLTSNALCASPAVVISNIIATNELTPDPEVTVSGNTLTAEISGANYQWYNCATNAPIPNATQQSYTATQSGSYSVLISAGGCSETSDCQTINWNSLDELSENGIILYPNPAKEYFIIDLPEHTTMDMTLFDIAGRKVMEGTVEGSAQQIDVHSLVDGSYQLVLRAGNKGYFAKVIVNH